MLPHMHCTHGLFVSDKEKPTDFLISQAINWAATPEPPLLLPEHIPEINLRNNEDNYQQQTWPPLIIFTGKVTPSSTLCNPANCIVCSQCAPAPEGLWLDQRGRLMCNCPTTGKIGCGRGPCKKSLLVTNIARRYALSCRLLHVLSDVASQLSGKDRRVEECARLEERD